MTAPTQLNPKDVADLLAKGQAVLFDVRDPDEFARRHVKGARLRPLASLESAPLDVPAGALPIFTCRSGMRTAAPGPCVCSGRHCTMPMRTAPVAVAFTVNSTSTG